MAIAAVSESDLQHRLEQTCRELERLRDENERLRTLLTLAQRSQTVITCAKDNRRTRSQAAEAPLDSGSAAVEKVALIRNLFRGREDVYALRWENARTGKSGYAPAVAGGWSGGRDGPKTYLPLSAEAIERHLRGRDSIGVYPLLTDDRCWFVACDLDGKTWQLDALALLDACADHEVPAALERSRSGSGAHVWVFFSAAVAAAAARRLGALLLREAMASRAELDLASYDRLFPSQDLLPQKGFGNLIALPLQGRCRRAGTSVFVDPATLEPWPDHWAFLSRLERVEPEQLERLIEANEDVPVGPAAIPARKRLRPDEPLPAEVVARSRPTSRSPRGACQHPCLPSSSTSPPCTTRSSTSVSDCGSPPIRRRA